MFLNDAVADRKPEAGPLADGLGGEERVEDPLADCRRDARSRYRSTSIRTPADSGSAPVRDRDGVVRVAGVDARS